MTGPDLERGSSRRPRLSRVLYRSWLILRLETLCFRKDFSSLRNVLQLVAFVTPTHSMYCPNQSVPMPIIIPVCCKRSPSSTPLFHQQPFDHGRGDQSRPILCRPIERKVVYVVSTDSTLRQVFSYGDLRTRRNQGFPTATQTAQALCHG